MPRPTEVDLELLESSFAAPKKSTLADLDGVRELSLDRPHWNDDTLAHLAGPTGVKIVEFHNKKVGEGHRR